ncbi:MAG: hypothetical protein IJO77_05720 [Oscillospiraceae bacterium]|nr:hypothetical protein [Oscillospiraceae bacterium]
MYFIAGSAGNPKFARVGEKKTAKLTIGVLCGKNKDTTPIYANVIAWGRMAESLCSVQKSDAVFAIARKEEREYNGKTYVDYIADYISAVPVRTGAEMADGEKLLNDMPKSMDAEETDENLPF